MFCFLFDKLLVSLGDDDSMMGLCDSLAEEIIALLCLRVYGSRSLNADEQFVYSVEPSGEVIDHCAMVLEGCLESESVASCGEVFGVYAHSSSLQCSVVVGAIGRRYGCVIVCPADVSHRRLGSHLFLVAVEGDEFFRWITAEKVLS